MGVLGAVEKSLARCGVHRPGESRVVVACSGGADSVALAAAVSTLIGARRVVLAHVDHAVRSTSIEDAERVAELAATLGAMFHLSRLAPGSSSEARLRSLRYAALEGARVEHGAEWIFTAHTADDQAETVLLNLLRAARPGSLRGIPRQRPTIFRPLLDVRRDEVRSYLMNERLAWRDDPTNLEPRWLRNRIRKELLPLLESRYRRGIARRLALLAATLQEENSSSSLTPNRTPTPTVPPFVSLQIAIERRPWAGGPLPADLTQAFFDADALDQVIVRGVRPGDRIRPLGLDGTKKISDVLIDAKVARELRSQIWVAAHPSGEVLWVPGLARAAAAPVVGTTTEVWVLSCGTPAKAPLSLGGS